MRLVVNRPHFSIWERRILGLVDPADIIIRERQAFEFDLLKAAKLSDLRYFTFVGSSHWLGEGNLRWRFEISAEMSEKWDLWSLYFIGICKASSNNHEPIESAQILPSYHRTENGHHRFHDFKVDMKRNVFFVHEERSQNWTAHPLPTGNFRDWTLYVSFKQLPDFTEESLDFPELVPKTGDKFVYNICFESL